MDPNLLRKSIENGNVEWKKHVTQRLFERGITREEIIRDYPEDIPCPSALFFGFATNRPIHVVAAYDTKSEITHIITAYEPSLNLFMDDFKTKKKV